jgi:hypothetical protein
MQYVPDDTPLFVLPKEAFTDEMGGMLNDIHFTLFSNELDSPPYPSFAVTGYYIDKSDGVSLDSLDLANWVRPYTVKFFKFERTPVDKKIVFLNTDDSKDMPGSEVKTILTYITQVFCSTKKLGNIVLDMETASVWIGAATKRPMNDKQRTATRVLSEMAYGRLIALLSLKPEEITTIKQVPKTGTSAQRRKQKDKFYTEIQIEFTPDLKRTILERHDTVNPRTGASKAPHMRRGFIKTQRYGPKFSMVKEIFVEAVHVNKDKGPPIPRQKYSLTVKEDRA